MQQELRVVSVEISGSNGTSKKLNYSPDFPFGMFQSEIPVPFFQLSHFLYQFQAFAAVFLLMKLICSNGKRDSGTKCTQS